MTSGMILCFTGVSPYPGWPHRGSNRRGRAKPCRPPRPPKRVGPPPSETPRAPQRPAGQAFYARAVAHAHRVTNKRPACDPASCGLRSLQCCVPFSLPRRHTRRGGRLVWRWPGQGWGDQGAPLRSRVRSLVQSSVGARAPPQVPPATGPRSLQGNCPGFRRAVPHHLHTSGDPVSPPRGTASGS